MFPTRNAIILAYEQKDGVTGPFGNFTTGFMDAIAVTADDLTTNVIIPQYAENGSEYYVENNGEGPLASATPGQIANLFDLAPAPPTVVFQDGEYSGITESNHMVNGATAKSIVTGGKSPGWVNDLIRFGIQYGLSQLSDVIEFAQFDLGLGATGSEGAWQAPATNGLSFLYQGELDDTVLPYERFTDPARALCTAAMGFLEEFQQVPEPRTRFQVCCRCEPAIGRLGRSSTTKPRYATQTRISTGMASPLVIVSDSKWTTLSLSTRLRPLSSIGTSIPLLNGRFRLAPTITWSTRCRKR